MNAPSLAISRLHARSAVREPVIARLAAETLAAEVAAALPPLPPQAVLMLRRLTLELPLHALDRLPDVRLRLRVATAARGAIAYAAAHAARPALGAVSAEVEAVWFGDEAELLACLARDGLENRLDCWWWRQLLGRAHPDWLAAWTDRPAAAPAALRLLARGGLLSPVLTALARQGVRTPGPERTAALRAVDETAAAPPRRTARAEAGHAAGTPGPAHSAAAPLPAEIEARRTRDPGLDAGPRRASFIAEAPHPERPACADAVAADLQDSPASPVRARRVDSPVPTVVGADGDGWKLPTADAGGKLSAPADEAPARPSAGIQNGRAQVRRYAARHSESRISARQAAPAAMSARQAIRLLREGAAAVTAQPQPGGSDEYGRAFTVPQAGSGPAGAFADSDDDFPAGPLDAAPRVVITRYGRLLFLVNLLLGDGLYPDFTRPLDPAFPLPIWQLLMLLGLGLVGPALRDDPLWRLLERLANDASFREASEAGAASSSPAPAVARLDAIDLDRHWPVPAPDRVRALRPLQDLRQRARRTRLLTARHHKPASSQAASPVPHPRRLRHAPAASLARWLARYRVSLRSRLAPALSVRPALVGRAFAGGPAQLWVSEADIVVVMPLDAHPVEWRLAGLDRDPGPLPGAGRALRFVFE